MEELPAAVGASAAVTLVLIAAIKQRWPWVTGAYTLLLGILIAPLTALAWQALVQTPGVGWGAAAAAGLLGWLTANGLYAVTSPLHENVRDPVSDISAPPRRDVP